MDIKVYRRLNDGERNDLFYLLTLANGFKKMSDAGWPMKAKVLFSQPIDRKS